jgi:hypothetical protein
MHAAFTGQSEHLIPEHSEHFNLEFINILICWFDERCGLKDDLIDVFSDFRKQVHNGSGNCT